MASLPLRGASSNARSTAAPADPCAEGICAAPWLTTTDPAFIAEWRKLAANASEPNPFVEEWFLTSALRVFDPEGSVKLIQFRQDGALCGLLPIKQSHSYYGYPIPHLRGWMQDNAFCGLPLVAAGQEKAFWRALVQWAGSSTASPIFLHLSQVPEEGPIFDALKQVIAEQGLLASIVQRSDRAILQSQLSADEYFAASMSGKKRKELRRQHKRLAELGVVAFERNSGNDGLEHWIDAFLALEAAGWKGREESALASSQTTKDLFSGALNGAADAGALERLSLTLDGRPIALLVNFLTPPGAYSFKTTFDEHYARFSPGVLLQRENLTMLDNTRISWTDSCAAADHPMIERIWRDKRTMLSVNIGIGGALRRGIFQQLIRRESGAKIIGAD